MSKANDFSLLIKKRGKYEPAISLEFVKPKKLQFPFEAYSDVEEIYENGTTISKTFKHIPNEIDA